MTVSVMPASRMVCAGCGAIAAPPYEFRCPRAGERDDVDHVLVRTSPASGRTVLHEAHHNPFVRERHMFHSYHLARAQGLDDEAYVEIVERLDDEIARVDGKGFRVTPFARQDRLSDALGFSSRGGVWVKDETRNVSGSHKARHLMGIMVYLQVLERIGLAPGRRPSLAIASCGNAALAAAVVARAAGWSLTVFIPPDAPATVVRRLKDLGAGLTICRRTSGTHGDPCFHAFQRAVGAGAWPFCCQGSENALAIEGGETLGYEMTDVVKDGDLDRVFLQVGGGALASSVIAAFTHAWERPPVVHAVQTRGGYPLARAYDRIAARVEQSLDIQGELRYAATHRSEFMWPWEETPRSIAHGILDDETYDWFAVVKGMFETSGFPQLVDEATLVEACELARASARIDVDHTGAAGLAGLLQLVRDGVVQPSENVAVIFSGVRRRP
jgi:threonine synthase